jgi:hypothetical protein
MRRITVTLAIVGLAVLAGGLPAQSDAVYHSEHLALRPVAGAPLRSGFVENIHPNGPNVYAHEVYVLMGAASATTYQVILVVFPTDTTCSAGGVQIPTASITTNAAGNGLGQAVLTPQDVAGLRGLTVGVMWLVTTDGIIGYATDCTTVMLD